VSNSGKVIDLYFVLASLCGSNDFNEVSNMSVYQQHECVPAT
jgi:hypothetical protein